MNPPIKATDSDAVNLPRLQILNRERYTSRPQVVIIFFVGTLEGKGTEIARTASWQAKFLTYDANVTAKEFYAVC